MTTETPKPVEVTQADSPEAIWLSPICDLDAHHGEGRTWASPAPDAECEDCGHPWVKYVRSDLSTRPEAQSLPTSEGLADAAASVIARWEHVDEGVMALGDCRAMNTRIYALHEALRAQPNDSTPSPVGPVDELQRLGQEFDAVGAEALRPAADILEDYIHFLHHMPASELEMHPHIRSVEEAFDRLSDALAALQAQPAVPDTLVAFDDGSLTGDLRRVMKGCYDEGMDEDGDTVARAIAALSRQPVEADGKCLICGGTRDQHDTGTGLLTCRGIAVPTYRPAPATGPSNEAEAWLIREIRGSKITVMSGQMFKRKDAAEAAALRLTNDWRLCIAFPVAALSRQPVEAERGSEAEGWRRTLERTLETASKAPAGWRIKLLSEGIREALNPSDGDPQ